MSQLVPWLLSQRPSSLGLLAERGTALRVAASVTVVGIGNATPSDTRLAR
jgi:hypothetical protein